MGGLASSSPRPANAATTCTGGTVTAMPGANNFSLAGGSLAGGAATRRAPSRSTSQSPARAAGTTPIRLPPARVTSAEGVTNAAATAATSSFPRRRRSPSTSRSRPTTVAVERHVDDVDPDPQQQRGRDRAVRRRPHRQPAVRHGRRESAGTDIPQHAARRWSPRSTVLRRSRCRAPPSRSTAICTINVTVRATASGNLINTIPPGGVTSAQGVTNPLLGSATLAATGTVNLNVTKTDGVASRDPGRHDDVHDQGDQRRPQQRRGNARQRHAARRRHVRRVDVCRARRARSAAPATGPIADTVTIPIGRFDHLHGPRDHCRERYGFDHQHGHDCRAGIGDQ